MQSVGNYGEMFERNVGHGSPLKLERGLDLVIVDYLQLMSGRGRYDSRQQEISDISRSLKEMAKELDLPIVALSQLSRAPEGRSDKRPMLSDLREVFNTANQQNTAIYALDPRGLSTGEFDVSDSASIGIKESQDFLRATQDTLQILAANTDGRAIIATGSPFDPVTFVGVPLLLAAVAVGIAPAPLPKKLRSPSRSSRANWVVLKLNISKASRAKKRALCRLFQNSSKKRVYKLMPRNVRPKPLVISLSCRNP